VITAGDEHVIRVGVLLPEHPFLLRPQSISAARRLHLFHAESQSYSCPEEMRGREIPERHARPILISESKTLISTFSGMLCFWVVVPVEPVFPCPHHPVPPVKLEKIIVVDNSLRRAHPK